MWQLIDEAQKLFINMGMSELCELFLTNKHRCEFSDVER